MGEHFLFNNIEGYKRSTAYVDSVLSDIMNVEGGMMCQMLVSLTKSFDEMIESIKKIIILIDWLRCRNLSRGVEKIDGQELLL